jgi:hypothetical protein
MLNNPYKKATASEKSSHKSRRQIFHGNHLVIYSGLYHDQAPYYNFCHGHQNPLAHKVRIDNFSDYITYLMVAELHKIKK